MNYNILKKDLTVYDTNGIAVLKVKGVEFAYLTIDKQGLIYLCNSFGQLRGDLFYIQSNNLEHPKLLVKETRIIDFSSDLSWILCLEEYSDDEYEGNLCIIEDLSKKTILAKNVYQAPILVFESPNTKKKVLFSKENGNIGIETYDLFLRNEEGKVIKIAEKVDEFEVLSQEDDIFSVVYFKPKSEQNWTKGNLFRFEEGKTIKLASDSYYQFALNQSCSQLLYMENVKNDIGNLLVASMDKTKTITLVNGVDVNDIHNIFRIAFMQRNNEWGEFLNFTSLKEEGLNVTKAKKKEYENLWGINQQTKNMSNTSNEYRVYFRKVIGKKFDVACELAGKGRLHKILDNYYPNDDSENHLVIFDEFQKDEIALLMCQLDRFFLTNENLLGESIYGVSFEDLLACCEAPRGLGKVNGQYLRGAKFIEPSYRYYIETIIEHLLKFHQVNSKRELYEKLVNRHSIIKNHNERSLRVYSDIRHKKGFNVIKKQIKEIESQMVLEGKIKSRWKSEQDLFKLVKANFNEAVMHASPSWLKPQSLDIYIEDKNLAFEYQGKQHYQPIDYFGGEEAFKKRLQLDQNKRNLCRENGVTLIEWRYDEAITRSNLEKKLNCTT